LTTLLALPILTTDVLTTTAAVNAIFPEWEALARHDLIEGFFRTPFWYLSWIRNMRPDAAPAVIVVRDGDKIVGIAPFCRLRYNACMWALSLAGEDLVCGEYLDVLARHEHRPAVMLAVWNTINQMRPQWDLVVLGAALVDGDLARVAQSWAAASGFMFRAEEDRVSPFIELPTAYDAYFATLGRKRRKNLARARRILEQHGVEVRLYTQPKELGPAIDTLIELHSLRWNRVQKSGTLGQPGFREFLKELSKAETQGRSFFRLYMMASRGRPVAAMLNFHYGKSALQFQNGFDPDWELAQHSPGSLLILHAIHRAIEEGLTCYDFLRGAEDYKFHFASHFKNTTTLAIARTLPARAYLLARDAGLAIRKFNPLARKERIAC
jgi:CelD/BcsL family acetyltransferase involved in cellulose biosynthesis